MAKAREFDAMIRPLSIVQKGHSGGMPHLPKHRQRTRTVLPKRLSFVRIDIHVAGNSGSRNSGDNA
jgi:hypothetical protein